ncbi:hypothetical protein HC928_11035, partial [bacterium]|nr:hypothetical protein [bacterium]
GQPQLYRRDRLLLEQSNGKYQAYGLTEQDCSAMERFNELSRQQAKDRLQQTESQQRQQQRQQEQEKEQAAQNREYER